MNKTFVYLAVTALLTGCASRVRTPDRIEVLHAQPVVEEHTIVSGETVNAIAAHYNMDPEQLVSINGLKPPYRLSIGQKLKVDNSDADMIVVKQIFYN